MLGMFHMLMMFLGIIRKRFKDAGLRDVLIQIQILAEGSVYNVLDGQMYNRSVQSCKLVYEALNRLLIAKMELTYKNDQEKNQIITSAQEEEQSHLLDFSTVDSVVPCETINPVFVS